MDNVVREILLAGGNENLLAGNFVGSVAIGNRLRLQQAQIGAAMGLGQVHGPAPFAGDHVRQIHLFLLVGAVVINRVGCAASETGIHAERHIRRRDHLRHRDRQNIRQPLTTIFRIERKALPAALFVDFIGFLEALRRRDRAIGVTGAAFLVAGMIDRVQHIRGHFGPFLENRRDHILAGV